MITPTEIKQNEQIRTYIEKADEALAALGYTEHSYAHVTRVAHFAEKIMADLGYPRRMQELAWIAGYMHDIGNVINRIDHASWACPRMRSQPCARPSATTTKARPSP